MATSEFINLGREYDNGPCCTSESKPGKKKISFPSLYISGVEGLKLGTGDITFTAKGRVVSVSERDTEDKGSQCSVEIEVKEISIPGAKEEDGLDSALTKIAKGKVDDADNDGDMNSDDDEDGE